MMTGELHRVQLGALVSSVTSGTVTSRDDLGEFTLYGSTGPIGRTENGKYQGKAVLVARVGANAGSVYRVCGKYGVTDNTLIVRPGGGLDVEYLAHFLSYLDLNKQVYGSGQPLITGRILKAIDFPLRSLAEQQTISSLLADTDLLLSTLTDLIAKKRAIKQGMMQELLTGRTRLPGFNSGWREERLSDVSTLKGRIGWQGLKQEEFTSNASDPFLITGMNFKDGAIRWPEVYHVSEERYAMAPEIQLRPGDVLMTKDGTIGKLLFVEQIPPPGKASLNSHLLLFRPKNSSYDPRFLYYQLSSPRFARHIELHKSGTTFFGISQESVGKYDVLLPPVDEQVAISSVLKDADGEIATLERRLEATRAIKQGMMQELLTGRTRLAVAEEVAG